MYVLIECMHVCTYVMYVSNVYMYACNVCNVMYVCM